MITPHDTQSGPGSLPDGMAYTQLVTQRHLDECSMALGRPLWSHEVQILDDMMRVLDQANFILQQKGQPKQMRSLDELVSLFVARVKKIEEGQRKIMVTRG